MSSVAFKAALLDKFPGFDPSWGEEQQSAWFAAVEKLMDMTADQSG